MWVNNFYTHHIDIQYEWPAITKHFQLCVCVFGFQCIYHTNITNITHHEKHTLYITHTPLHLHIPTHTPPHIYTYPTKITSFQPFYSFLGEFGRINLKNGHSMHIRCSWLIMIFVDGGQFFYTHHIDTQYEWPAITKHFELCVCVFWFSMYLLHKHHKHHTPRKTFICFLNMIEIN